MTRCDYRVYALDGPILPDGDFFQSLREIRCEDEATETYTYTVPRLIDVHGESEHLCAIHVTAQREAEAVHRYLATPQGIADVWGDS
jgi:hypothetical protein